MRFRRRIFVTIIVNRDDTISPPCPSLKAESHRQCNKCLGLRAAGTPLNRGQFTSDNRSYSSHFSALIWRSDILPITPANCDQMVDRTARYR